MQNFIRQSARSVLKNNFIWSVFKPLVRASEFLKYQRSLSQVDPATAIAQKKFEEIKSILKEPVVKHGPFKGLKYPDYTSYGSTIFPKIIGCYENEIAGVFNNFSEKNYSEIIDIGCAEGYYAVGMAMKMPDAMIYAYDIDENSRSYCQQLAQLNGVVDKIEIRSECSENELAVFSFTVKGFILCDCEGYEKYLFTEHSAKNLANCDLLIETHDFIDIDISGHIKSVFSNTHQLTIIKSVDDIEKARTYDFPETSNLDLKIKKEIFREGRPAIMEWYFLESKNSR